MKRDCLTAFLPLFHDTVSWPIDKNEDHIIDYFVHNLSV